MFSNTAYVLENGNDSTGIIGNPLKPFLTVAAALVAAQSLSAPIVVKIGLFATDTPPENLLSRENITLIGTVKPYYNVAMTQASMSGIGLPGPTRLVGGTVLRGPMHFKDVSTGVKVYNLGVDVGPDYLSAEGVEGNGVLLYRSTANDGGTTDVTPYGLTSNVEIKNVIVLGKNSSSLFHGLDIENCFDPCIEDITTCYAVHGVAVKSNYGRVRNITAFNHASDGIIIKSNNYSVCNKLILDGFATYNCGTGVILQNRSLASMQDINIVNGYTQGGVNGFKTIDDYGNGFNGINIENVKVRGASGTPIVTTGLSTANARVVGCWGNGTLVQI